MMHFIRRRLLWFLIGFVISFLVYLFVKFDADEVLEGMTIAVAVGFGVSLLIFFLERRFPDKTGAVTGDPEQK